MADRNGPEPGEAAGSGTFIAHHARHRPDAVAIVHRGVALTWRTLAANILATMDEVRALGLRPGQTLGIEVDDRYLHLLIMLAAETLGLVTVSFSAANLGPPADLGRLCDRIVVSQPPIAHADKAWALTPDFPVRVMTRTGHDPDLSRLERDHAPDAVLRLMTTSGTTGRPKVLPMTHGLLLRLIRVLAHPMAPGVLRDPVFLCLYRYTIRATHTRTMLVLRQGGTIHFTGLDVLWDVVRRGTGNYLLLLSGDLERFVSAAPATGGPFDLHIDIIGGAVPDRLRAETLRSVSRQLVSTYATNETHSVSLVGEGGIGRLYPGAHVMIVDDAGNPVPDGAQGRIRVRTSSMVDGYLDAPDQDRAAFIDGWYQTGDFGYQPDSETLVVLGRTDDVLNVGGIKIAPAPIEARIRDVAGVADALVTDGGGASMTGEMLVAVEMRPDADRTSVARQIDRIVRSYVGAYRPLLLSALPRTENGKIRREAVRELARRHADGG
jgi:acyl-coenzyme A synthetase/AMP-(fatty) acid ligase